MLIVALTGWAQSNDRRVEPADSAAVITDRPALRCIVGRRTHSETFLNRENRSQRSKSFLIRAVFLLYFALPYAHAEKYALLIGINHYAATGVPDLQGPLNDVAALRRMLVTKWQFKAENVKTLLDGDATRSGILGALDAYSTTLRTGDFLFLYYSGHGTSWFAKDKPRTAITADTGAILSYDLTLIIGNQDLQPRLRKLDSLAEVFAVFDSCYSGNSIKSVAVAPSRYLSPDVVKSVPADNIAQYDREFSAFDRFTATESYPYRRLLYLSAASKAEEAADIQRSLLAQGFHTIDGLSHGAFTDALLQGLSGEADTNHDGRITYQELYQFTRQWVTRNFSQTPQFLFPASDPGLADSAVFSVEKVSSPAAAPVGAATAAALRVKLEGGATALRAKLAAVPGVVVSGGQFDLLVRGYNGGFELYHQSGSLIRSYAPDSEAELMRRIESEGEVRRLIDISYSRQDFNITLTIDPAGRGFFAVGDHLRFRARSERDCYLLLLDIDVSGTITILSPRSSKEIASTAAGADSPIGPESQVEPPTGMEYLKLFAFRDKPDGLEALASLSGDSIAPGTPAFDQLMAIVGQDLPGRAATQVKLVTAE